MSSPPPSYNQATGPGYPYGGGQQAFNNPSPGAPYPSQGRQHCRHLTAHMKAISSVPAPTDSSSVNNEKNGV